MYTRKDIYRFKKEKRKSDCRPFRVTNLIHAGPRTPYHSQRRSGHPWACQREGGHRRDNDGGVSNTHVPPVIAQGEVFRGDEEGKAPEGEEGGKHPCTCCDHLRRGLRRRRGRQGTCRGRRWKRRGMVSSRDRRNVLWYLWGYCSCWRSANSLEFRRRETRVRKVEAFHANMLISSCYVKYQIVE